MANARVAGPGFSYHAKGGSMVVVPQKIDPYFTLGLRPGASVRQEKEAFRTRIATSDRQTRAVVSYARHILAAPGRYVPDRRLDVYDYAIAGWTAGLRNALDRDPSLLDREDETGRTLLYIAARSGFYDTCELLLERGASFAGCARDKSSPLHAASFFGQPLVCALLVQHGASVTARNSYGNTPMEEACNEEVRSKLCVLGSDAIASFTSQAAPLFGGAEMETIRFRGMDVARRVNVRACPCDWMEAWHGTKFEFLLNILRHGLRPSGSRVGGVSIEPPRGHYRLGETHFGIRNWARAIFVSPSVLYAGHTCYSERIVSQGTQWCCMVMCGVRPNTFTAHPSTVVGTTMDDEPDTPEWRIDVGGDDVIWRQGNSEHVLVAGIMFINLQFFETIGKGGPSYNDAKRLLLGPA